jgi:hypothetical protein
MMYVEFVEKSLSPKNLRVVLEGELKDQFAGLLERKQISQQKAIEQLVRFVVAQEDVAQSMLLGQIEPTDDLLEIVLRKRRHGHFPRKAATPKPKPPSE